MKNLVIYIIIIIINILTVSVVWGNVRAEETDSLLQDDMCWRMLSGVSEWSSPSPLWCLLTSSCVAIPVCDRFQQYLAWVFQEAVRPGDMAKLCLLLTLNSGEERFLSAQEAFDLTPYIVIDVFFSQRSCGEKFLKLFFSNVWILFLASARSVQVLYL